MNQRLSGGAKPIRRSRRLPIPGAVLVHLGQAVTADTLIARAEIPGVPIPVRVAAKLSIDPAQIGRYMLKQVGETIEAGEPLALLTSFFGRSKEYVVAPRTGTVESISTTSGVVTLREPSIPVSTAAYLPGMIAEIMPGEGAVIEASALVFYGVFGVGSERYGRLMVVTDSIEQQLTPELLTKDTAGAVILVGGTVSAAVLRRAAELKVAGIIAGSVDNAALREYLGYEIGVPITGQEDIVTSLIITTGFGELPMEDALWHALLTHTGEMLSINGTTHLRSKLVRPEIIVPAE